MANNETAQEAEPKRRKVSYVGVPAIFKLELACQHINSAFAGYGCYLVGSALERADWRDIDIVFIMEDEAFAREFPDVVMPGFESDPKWLLNSISLSMWLREQSGLPVDFKVQSQSWSNERHKGPRHPLGKRYCKP
jgi:hypothetical protein